VVAARSGACPEIVTDEAIGRLFEPDEPEDLARAMDEALELGAEPQTAQRCREHARQFDISHAVDAFERLYETATGNGRAP
jgi:glycosyltransferase involved in cell wall biosynthesis